MLQNMQMFKRAGWILIVEENFDLTFDFNIPLNAYLGTLKPIPEANLIWFCLTYKLFSEVLFKTCRWHIVRFLSFGGVKQVFSFHVSNYIDPSEYNEYYVRKLKSRDFPHPIIGKNPICIAENSRIQQT